jgi:uncharacterized protein (TIGR02285 family)
MHWLRCSCLFLLLSCQPLHSEPLQIVDTLGSLQPHAGQEPIESHILRRILQQYPAPYSLIEISRNRAREWTKTAGNACIPWLRKTPDRERDYLFSLPYMLESGITLVSLPDSNWHRALEKQQNAQGKISLAQLLQLPRPPLIGIERNRSYGDQIDALLQQHQANAAIYTRSTAGESVGSMLPMLHKGFVDLMLEYPKIAARSQTAVYFWPLVEAEPYNAVFFACSRSAAGEKIIGLFNQVIRQQAASTAYQQLVLQSFPAADRAQVLHDWQLMFSNP